MKSVTNLCSPVQALQSYEYMEKRSLGSDDPFYLSGEKWLDRNLLKKIVGNNAGRLIKDKSKAFDARGYWEIGPGDADRFSDTRRENYRRNWFTGFYQRLGAATVAGIFLIVPMWLMVLHKTLWTALVSTTVFVVVFWSIGGMVSYELYGGYVEYRCLCCRACSLCWIDY